MDPRLLRYSPSARRYVLITAVFAALTVVAVIVGAVALAGLLSELITEPDARSFSAQSTHLWVIAAAFGVRAVMSYLSDRYAHRAAFGSIRELRGAAVDVLTDPARTSPRELLTVRERALTVALRGLDSLSDYFAGYLPALLGTAIITPVVVAVIAWADLTSAVIVLVTIPLIPLFMVLIGLMTQDRVERKLESMSALTAQLLDLMTGLPTLRALGRAQSPAARVAKLGQNLKRSSMAALRIAFLSGAVLEMIATLSVAVVAVSIGLRLVFGEMPLYAGVLALILAPEAYLPLRQIGAQFHNAQDGMAAADEVLAFIDGPDSGKADAQPGGREVSRVREVSLQSVGVEGRDGWAPRGLSAEFASGQVTVLTGPNGCGKSTVLSVLLGLLAPDEGRVLVDGTALTELDLASYRSTTAWLPQQPVVAPGTVADNLALFGALDPGRLDDATRATGFDVVLAELSEGADTVLGAGGAGLSAGQRQRLALTRTLAAPASLVLLDEPTAHLDSESELRVLAEVRRRAREGATVVMVAHHGAALDAGDVVLELPAVGASAGDVHVD
ncbi:MAG: thiol reductant ABC exporter subunit CydD [Gordonia sp. (in: high G+C Gram-positive bacteria)]